MGPEMRLTRICCCCCLLYQLGFLSHGTTSGLQLTPDLEEWEVVFPALWRRESLNATGLSGGSSDPGSGRSSGGGGRGQASGSSREVRSVARAPQEEATRGQSEPWFGSPLEPGAEDEEELESQELPRGSSGDTALSSGTPASWQPPLPPQRPSSPPPAQQEEPSAEEVLLRIPALSRDLYLLLRRDGRFLAQRFAVEQWPKPGPDPTRATADPGSSLLPDASCFYTGTVLRHPGSLASFSTCGGGLMGFIQLNEDFLFIEPFNDTMAIIGHPHRLYRQKRSTEEKVTENSAVHRHHCGVISDKGRPRSKKIADNRREKRYSYKLSQEYNIETVVVADPAMVSYHGADAARRFILTILNMVFNLFQHKSLGVQVNLRVLKLILLHETPADLYIGHHGEKMLESFCKWQHEEFGRRNDVHLEMSTSWGEDIAAVDAAILITRKDFCVHKDEPCDTVGIAYLNGMCSEKRKCIIAEDNGLNLAFTIAHEMGHNMGINHDNDHPSCADGLHIMSGEWIKGQNLGDVSWSRCSKEDLERFLRSKASSCLLHTDPQSLSSVLVPSKLPGMAYTADEQCQILFGPLASFCQEMQHVICTGLWCKVEGEAECRTKLDPPMDGTDCDPGKWCKAGECTRRTPAPEHLAGEWSPWSSCSRSCSSGVSSRERKCPGLGSEARDCNGPRKQYRICENPPCPAGLPGFRDWQCQAYSVRTSYPKHALQWQAVFDEEKPCALFCSPVGKEQPVLLSEKVMDGTSCGYQGLDICANGRCQKAGCDGLLGSLAREDHCGVCNGNGKSCKVIKGDFNHTRGAGYVEVLVIPAGARRIKVVEEKPAHSFLALRDASKQSINSDWKIEHSGAFSLAGTTVHYLRRGLWEKISAKGPTTTPLHLLVLLFQDQNYGLHYEYTVPSDPLPDNQSSKEPGPLFMWTHAGWGDCNATCGGGERKTMVSCTKIMSKNISLVDNKKCKDLTKPEPQIRKCNEQPCQTRWMMTEWTTCSRTCGKGVQSRQVACTQQLENGTLIRAWERDCLGPKPATVQRCEGQDCMTVWEAGVWSECSVKCGKGVRHRTVRCTNPRKKCVLSTRPREAEDCEDYSKCYVWRVGDWSKCSITCGKGMQSRVIQCMHKITGRHGNECFSSEKPAAYRPCHLQPCNEKINVNTITSPRLAALTFKCLGDQWPVYCRVIREKNLCQDMRWYQRCCETCRDFYAQKLQQKS
ncbi:A disintegrin and metalloproteinase with thrombospondin motifs 19 preproprotein [Mus musculus]|uniref:A disintegrin and metalloproteinase with thrombospondin motifs 19 n=1 Tax=Mus musculus TaxID=10090 RepID=ATS19_MOUSE|nr:A disintegrin and metalloproteinase with thrombospondin motifs 19 preproprotein [Mus musculus]P59509.1 RecName: Full=A disintegrin and metalloproteinase with thrombospondin motifs 19; Short=ADAM-TS 19; Short=ADAM-TS19; Short=ADAMTS-19; Flags: Precursor [Mus musculus]AAN10155.1 secreted metalloprotease ADAMTS19 [Mus musculus]EDL09848.1 a disintegrin-like and metallopeptidase (reprolysin type) with thrombospondin type 1 motif, 19, isoform CRA_b [Mus musculus]|eukprot:NP_780715.1 A disintegrin and metalloproteinase with thrombospondin motifs 19 precursor [Mus musculus]